MKDERIIEQENHIYKKCFYIMSGVFLADILLKFNLFGVLYSLTDTIALFMWIEAIALIAIFYIAFFSLAKKGIAIGAEESEGSPVKAHLKISLVLGALISIGMWTLRWCVFDWSISEIRGAVAVILITAIYLVTFALAFAISYFSLRLSYKIARKALERELE